MQGDATTVGIADDIHFPSGQHFGQQIRGGGQVRGGVAGVTVTRQVNRGNLVVTCQNGEEAVRRKPGLRESV